MRKHSKEGAPPMEALLRDYGVCMHIWETAKLYMYTLLLATMQCMFTCDAMLHVILMGVLLWECCYGGVAMVV